MSAIDAAQVNLMLTELRLPTVKAVWQTLAERADKEGWPAARLLAALAEQEIAERNRRRFERHLAEAKLPPGKTLANFEFDIVPMVSKAHVNALVAGDRWLDQGANLILIGNPGGGKSHLAAAIGLALIENGFRVLYTRTTDLVQRLQVARRELMLETAIRKLNKYHLLILDDIAYVRKDQAETSVLFELISSRYEYRSMLITANQAVRRVGIDLPRSGHDARRRRPPGPPRHDLRTQRRELSPPRCHRLFSGQAQPRPGGRARHTGEHRSLHHGYRRSRTTRQPRATHE